MKDVFKKGEYYLVIPIEREKQPKREEVYGGATERKSRAGCEKGSKVAQAREEGRQSLTLCPNPHRGPSVQFREDVVG